MTKYLSDSKMQVQCDEIINAHHEKTRCTGLRGWCALPSLGYDHYPVWDPYLFCSLLYPKIQGRTVKRML